MNNWKQYIFFIDFFYDSWVSGDLFFLKSYSRNNKLINDWEQSVSVSKGINSEQTRLDNRLNLHAGGAIFKYLIKD